MPNIPTEGAFTPPPVDAPYEVTQPVDNGALLAEAAQRRAAAAERLGISADERSLAPLNPPGDRQSPQPPADLPLRSAAPTAYVVPQTSNPMPAASGSDSPARGIPREITDPGKKITGGFGNTGEAQYYPLNGLELLVLVRSLMEQIDKRIENDLRFAMAITYPRVRARVVIEVDGYAESGDFAIEKVDVREKTPIEVARQYGDRIAFAVVEKRQEFTDSGEVDAPPDLIRDELGLEKPRKQLIQMGAQRIVADIPIEGSF
jgi:hypothetical protein